MKWVNPLNFPLAVLAGGIVLVLGVRWIKLPNLVILPIAAGTTVAGAFLLQRRQPTVILSDNPALDQELQSVRQQAQTLKQQADRLRAEAAQLLTASHQVDLLGAVEYACDRAHELPAKVEQLSSRMSGHQALLSIQDLQQQLAQVERKCASSSGAARQQWSNLAERLGRNMQLAQQGEDARQAQVISLSALILDAGGVLQQLQNKLRTANLDDLTETTELRALSEELSRYQENVDLLLS